MCREWDKDTLRRGLVGSASKATPAAAVQEIRLVLTEFLLGQGKTQEAIQLMVEATSLRHLNAGGDVGQLFWMAELEWRAGNANATFALLREALDIVDGTPDEPCGLSKLHILHTPFLRLNIMGRKHETAETMARTVRLLAARGDK